MTSSWIVGERLKRLAGGSPSRQRRFRRVPVQTRCSRWHGFRRDRQTQSRVLSRLDLSLIAGAFNTCWRLKVWSWIYRRSCLALAQSLNSVTRSRSAPSSVPLHLVAPASLLLSSHELEEVRSVWTRATRCVPAGDRPLILHDAIPAPVVLEYSGRGPDAEHCYSR